jgi:hypothetical protein
MYDNVDVVLLLISLSKVISRYIDHQTTFQVSRKLPSHLTFIAFEAANGCERTILRRRLADVVTLVLEKLNVIFQLRLKSVVLAILESAVEFKRQRSSSETRAIY